MPKGQSRNTELAPGVMRYSRAQMRQMARRYRFIGKGGEKKAAAAPAPEKITRFYPADDVAKPLARHHTPKTAKLRASIQPGQVLILLAGRFKGKRVVFLQQLPSGLLLVTGPYKLNGVPMRRVNQAYVIATSTRLDVSGVSVPAAATEDKFFAVGKAQRAALRKEWKEDQETFLKQNSDSLPKAGPSDERKAAQAAVDEAILSIPAMDDVMKAYLGTTFALSKGDKPHEMLF